MKGKNTKARKSTKKREHEDEHEEGGVAIDLENRRTAFRMEWLDLGGVFESAELDFGYGDYQHIELEGEEGRARSRYRF